MDISPQDAELVANFITRNLPNITALGKGLFKGAAGEVKLRLRRTYQTYLTSASEKYGKAKSFFIRSVPTKIYDFYVPLGVTHGKEKIPQIGYVEVVALTTRAVITGAAGSGKSMLMRHLFLSALGDGNKVPVFVELRNANTNSATVRDLIFDSLRDHGFNLEDAFISKALKAGHFAIFLDGYDEVTHSRRNEIARAILALSQKAPECTIMVSSRPDDIFGGWQDFSSLHINPLELEEACELVDKLPFDEELKSKFLSDLRKDLFQRHESFLSNPLLLSIMLLTYGQSADIPKNLSVFYNQAYETLFNRHDALKAGYQRDRLCDLDILDFSRIFAAFCVQTYDRRLFQFSRSDALTFLEKAKIAVAIEVDSENYLDDSLQSVCLLVEDGLLLAFAHRSFQEYFVARFISEAAPTIQRRLIDRFCPNLRRDSVIDLLYELNQDLVERELLIPKLNQLFNKIGVKREVGITHLMRFLKSEYAAIVARDEKLGLMLLGPYKDPRYKDIIHFTLKYDPEWLRTVDKWGEKEDKERKRFVMKYFGDDPNRENLLSSLTHRSPIIQEFADLDGYFSIPWLQAVYLRKKKLEAKHKRSGRSLDALLSE